MRSFLSLESEMSFRGKEFRWPGRVRAHVTAKRQVPISPTVQEEWQLWPHPNLATWKPEREWNQCARESLVRLLMEHIPSQLETDRIRDQIHGKR